MAPQEKAQELVKKFKHSSTLSVFTDRQAKQCALVAVDSHIYSENDSPFDTMENWIRDNRYWKEVRTEIEKL